MHRIFSAFTAAAVLVALGQSAGAADLAQRPAAAPLLTPTPVYNWTGIYFGINGGGGWGRQDPLNLISNCFDGKSVDFSGGLFGGTAGARIQSGHVVIGLEADIDWANMKGSATYIPTVGGIPITPAAISATTNIDWEATARARIGYAEQNWLFYATGWLGCFGYQNQRCSSLGVNVRQFTSNQLLGDQQTNWRGARRRYRVRIYSEHQRKA